MSELTHISGVSLGDVLPELDKAAKELSKSVTELTTRIDDDGNVVNAWESQRKALQDKLTKAENLVNNLQNKVDEADALLTAARDLVTDTLDSLGVGGFHKFTYAGSLGDFPAAITHHETGMEEVTGWQDSSPIYVVMVVAGAGSNPVEDAQRIAAMAKNFAVTGWSIDGG